MELNQDTVRRADELVARGFCSGNGSADGQMCVEEAGSILAGEPFGDNLACSIRSARSMAIGLNDSTRWVSAQSRALGLRNLLLAQLGSAGVVDDVAFTKRVAELTIQRLIPALFREVFPDSADCLAAADRCEQEGTQEAATAARDAARAAYARAAYAAAAAAAARAADAAADAAYAAARAAGAASDPERYLRMSAGIAVEVLREMESPGCALLGAK